jgi:hypothetical protein
VVTVMFVTVQMHVIDRISEETKTMSLTERVTALKQRHEALQHQIDAEETRPLPDEAQIAVLKKQKLRIKDELADLETRH